MWLCMYVSYLLRNGWTDMAEIRKKSGQFIFDDKLVSKQFVKQFVGKQYVSLEGDEALPISDSGCVSDKDDSINMMKYLKC